MKDNKKFFNLLDKYMEDDNNTYLTEELDDEELELFHFSKNIVDSNKNIKIGNKEASYNKLFNTKNKENIDMKLNKKIAGIGLATLIGITSIQTGFAQNVYTKIKQVFSLNYVTVEEEDFDNRVPDDLAGTLFDKDGHELKFIYPNSDIYDKDGNLLKTINLNGQTINLEKSDDTSEDDFYYTDDLNFAKSKLIFDLKIPSYLPDGYNLKRVVLFKDKNGDISSEYCSLEYTNGKDEFSISERLASDKNSFESGGFNVEEINLNGNKAILSNNRNIDMEIDDTILSILGQKALNKTEVIKVAESIK